MRQSGRTAQNTRSVKTAYKEGHLPDGNRYIDNTMRYCFEKNKSSGITHNDIEIDKIVQIYSNCTIHPICADLKNYNRFDNVFEQYINTKIECPDIKCNTIKSLKKIQYKCNKLLFRYKKLTYQERCRLNDLFIQEKICADNIEYDLKYCNYTHMVYRPKINISYPSAMSKTTSNTE